MIAHHLLYQTKKKIEIKHHKNNQIVNNITVSVVNLDLKVNKNNNSSSNNNNIWQKVKV